jgi:hypothetical protein
LRLGQTARDSAAPKAQYKTSTAPDKGAAHLLLPGTSMFGEYEASPQGPHPTTVQSIGSGMVDARDVDADNGDGATVAQRQHGVTATED